MQKLLCFITKWSLESVEELSRYYDKLEAEFVSDCDFQKVLGSDDGSRADDFVKANEIREKSYKNCLLPKDHPDYKPHDTRLVEYCKYTNHTFMYSPLTLLRTLTMVSDDLALNVSLKNFFESQREDYETLVIKLRRLFDRIFEKYQPGFVTNYVAFVNERKGFTSESCEILTEKHGAKVKCIDFYMKEDAHRIVNEVSEELTGEAFFTDTDHQFLDRGIGFINTVVINARWVNEFDEKDSITKEFRLPYRRVYMEKMRQSGPFKVYRDKDVEVLEMEMMMGRKLCSFLIIQPLELEKQLIKTLQNFDKIIRKAFKYFKANRHETIDVEIPRLKITTVGNNDCITDYLNPETEMLRSYTTGKEAIVRKMYRFRHKVTLDLNEKGIGTEEGQASPERSRIRNLSEDKFNCNKPSIWCIVDRDGSDKGDYEDPLVLLVVKFVGPH